ncbi:protein polybromo-1 [Condylostylus longicornis]|uniref:protein polybromo-1 n=1 Tax=Condylostylus longicornis TaxID=2530218 RepID=UPI00244DFAD1|nr:protein polybromo-1 [Condylostylus longicornis]
MLSKRKRASSVASRQDEDIADDSAPELSPVITVGRKRKRPDASELCQLIYDSIRNIKKDDNSMLCDTFIRAPKRRQEPAYYEVVANPIDLLRVQQKLKTDSYDDVEELTSDFDLLIKNAKAFYKPGSTEYSDACTLWDLFLTNKTKILESNCGDDEPRKRIGRQPRRSIASDGETAKLEEDFDPYEELFAAVMTASDPLDGRPLNIQFQLLPSKKVYPEYYDVVEHPIDLKLVANKIQTNAYSNLSEMEKDLLQMVKNACVFNEPGSQIYKDAKTLKKIFTARKTDIETGKIKSLSKKRGLSYSATVAALKDEPESSTDDDEDEEKKGEGPMWQLFDYLYNYASSSDNPNVTGAPLGQSLWKLPHRRFRPEYYELIKKPISMAQIQNKLKKGEYVNISDMTADLYLMIDNAKKAFPPTHRIHKDALKMLKIMNNKLIDEGLEQENTDSNDTDVLDTPPKKKGRPRLSSAATMSTPSISTIASNPANTSPKFKTQTINFAMKKKLLNIQKYLEEYTISDRQPMLLFMEKPSKKLYPDYYDVILHPIDMNTIENNLRSDKYATLDEVVADYRLMFSNCRKYNEEGSMIFEDANILEKVLNEKLREHFGFIEKKLTPKITKTVRKFVSQMDSKLWQFYDTIRDYHEPKGNRQLSVIFMKLPSKNDYPDYYDIIKNPVDMEKIAQKLRQQSYENVDDLAADFMLMFENACKYNEPDSQIYKDALILQQITIQTKQSLRERDERVPDVQLAVQELLISLFTALYNHQDEEGRCYSDSLAELPEYDDVNLNKVRGISLDLIKRRLDKGLYKRLDTFQEDVFLCLERGRKLSRTDSQVFEDSIELQTFFINKRDELCKGVLSSPALNYKISHLNETVEAIRQSKSMLEEQDLEEPDTAATQGESMTIDQKVFSPGDFVYFDTPDNQLPGIAYIERLYTDVNNVKMMQGNIFFRPHETYHVTTRKFLEREVFKSDQHLAIPIDKVQNKCYVMSVKDFIRFKPEGYQDKDVYVCESRYSMRLRSFKKIKNWAFVRDNDKIKFTLREKVIELKRVMSVFKERIEKHKGELAELQLQEALIEKEKPNVIFPMNNVSEGYVYYEQYNTACGGAVKTGDFVYVATQSGKQSIAQIHTIWETPEGESYFQGPWLILPNEITPNINRTFNRQEIFLSTVQDKNPTIAIVGKCAVLEVAEYMKQRPTEIPECDVFICENIYDESRKCIKKLPNSAGLKKYKHNPSVTLDEIFYFRETIKLQKGVVKSEKVDKIETGDGLDTFDDSTDGGSPSVNSDVQISSSPALSIASTPNTTKKKLKQPNKSKFTGYILYSGEVRKAICQNNRDASFGDISRMIANDWKNLPAHIKQSWEDKAVKINEEKRLLLGKQEAEENENCSSPIPGETINQVYECLWNKCDFQFEDLTDCMEHCLAESTGHVYTHYSKVESESPIEYHCFWKNCIRLRKNMPAFPHLLRLIRHVREVHLNKGGRILSPNDRSKNFVQKKISSVQISNGTTNMSNNFVTNQILHSSPSVVQNTQLTTNPPEPMFVSVPPRPQRVLHSEAYIKYIEGLQNNTSNASSWEKTLQPTHLTQNIEPPKEIMNWFGSAAKQNPEAVINALWHLRNFMVEETLQIKNKIF